MLISYLGRGAKDGSTLFFVAIWTQPKVPTTSGVIDCMAKKKGHLSATPCLDPTPQQGRHTHVCSHAHTQILYTERTSHSATADWLEVPVTLNCQFFHLEHVLSCQSANEVCVMSLSRLRALAFPQPECGCHVRVFVSVCLCAEKKKKTLFIEPVRSCDKQEKRRAENSSAFGDGPLITWWWRANTHTQTHTETVHAHPWNTCINSICSVIATRGHRTCKYQPR